MRMSKHEMYMGVAETVAKRSHDAETQVGAVLVKNDSGAIIATGFNGFIRGADDSNLPNKRPDKYEHIIHAEENLISNCARLGISTENCTLYCTLSPCTHCARLMWQCGITSIVAKGLYKDIEQIKAMPDLKIAMETSKEHPYHVLRYST